MASNPGNPFGIPGFAGLPGGDGASSNPVLQGMEMMRQAWSNFGALSGTTPSLSAAMSPEELDKRIAELRAVENWLNLNLNMLRGSIQGLEVQRATIATLRSFTQPADAGAETAAPSPAPWWNMLQEQFGRMASAAAATTAAYTPAAKKTPPSSARKRAAAKPKSAS